MSPDAQPGRLAVLLSGGGRTVINLLDTIERGELNAAVVSVIASRLSAGVERCRARGLEVFAATRAAFPEPAARDDAITRRIVESRADLVCLCGYLRRIRLDPPLRGRVINIHPSLLPDFGGQGMYGDRVHAAVLAAGRRFSGCTVHFVDDGYDEGPVIVQRACHVRPDDDVDRLAARVFEQECLAYPEAIRLVLGGRARLREGRARLT